MLNLIVISISAILIENFVLVKFYGCCPFLGVSTKSSTAVGMGMAVVFTMTLTSALTYPLYWFVLKPLGLEYLQTIAFIVVIATLVQIIEMFLQKSIPALYSALGIYHHKLRCFGRCTSEHQQGIQFYRIRSLRFFCRRWFLACDLPSFRCS